MGRLVCWRTCWFTRFRMFAVPDDGEVAGQSQLLTLEARLS
ncbi:MULTISPECIES: hypothetical protein [unclassified Streptomyces]|nr:MULTISPECIES: hypothetical protein [unclassified Streptomyces]